MRRFVYFLFGGGATASASFEDDDGAFEEDEDGVFEEDEDVAFEDEDGDINGDIKGEDVAEGATFDAEAEDDGAFRFFLRPRRW